MDNNTPPLLDTMREANDIHREAQKMHRMVHSLAAQSTLSESVKPHMQRIDVLIGEIDQAIENAAQAFRMGNAEAAHQAVIIADNRFAEMGSLSGHVLIDGLTNRPGGVADLRLPGVVIFDSSAEMDDEDFIESIWPTKDED